MTYPRMSALAEAAWTLPENKDYDQFMNRLPMMLEHLRDQGIYLFDPFNPESTPEPEL
jgi:hexosaminidase